MKRLLPPVCAAIAFVSAALAGDRAGMQAEALRLGFDKAEELRLAASADGDGAKVMALAELYAAHQLWPEALFALKRLKRQDAVAERLAAEARYALGRYRQLAAETADDDAARGFRAMALVRRGAFTQALAEFQIARAPEGFQADYHYALAEAQIAAGDAKAAADALARAAASDGDGMNLSRRRFLRAALLRLNGDEAKARAEFRRAGAEAPDEWSMRARLALADEVELLPGLSLEWKGDALDRESLMRKAAAGAKARDFSRALGAYAEIAARFPESDAALTAQADGGKLLAALFEDKTVSPADAARIFFEHVAFAPPGKEGDALIRSVATRLKALGLYAEAAALIDHQVFKRLRGADRSRIAADLAELHLAARKPQAALAALRATRIAGLDPETNARRRRLEAAALGKLGKREAALTLLKDASQPADQRLRAEIAWDSGDWLRSASDYASLFAAAPAPLSRNDREAAVRAATAYLLAGDRDAYRAFIDESVSRLHGAREEALIRSLGDVDRDNFLGRFMDDYRALYSAPDS